MALQYIIDTLGCPGINHADFSIDGRIAIFTCEFSSTLAKIDLAGRKVLDCVQPKMPATRFAEVPNAPRTQAGKVWEPGESEICTATRGMPQDIRISPDGKRFYITDLHADGVHIVDGWSFTQVGFIHTGLGAHGLYPSRDGKRRSSPNAARTRSTARAWGLGNGGVVVIDFASEEVVARWPVPGGDSLDMGNVTQVRVGKDPHRLTV